MAIFASTPSETVRGSAVNADAPTIFIGRGRYSCENSQNVPNSADGDNELRDLAVLLIELGGGGGGESGEEERKEPVVRERQSEI